MSKEREKILKLLEENKITAKEALELLDAIGENDNDSSVNQGLNVGESIANMVKKTVSFALNRSQDAINFAENLESNRGDKKGYYYKKDVPSYDIEDLELQLEYGDIDIIPSDNDKIEVILNTSTEKEESEIDDEIKIEGNKLIIKPKCQKKKSGIKFIYVNNKSYNNLTIKIPENKKLNSVLFGTSYGDVNISGIKADTLDIKSGYGDIDSKGLICKDIAFHSGYGDIMTEYSTFENLKGRTGMGDISMSLIRGEALNINLNTGMGDIKLDLTGLSTNQEIITSHAPYVCTLKLANRFRKLQGNIGNEKRATFNQKSEKTTTVKLKTGMGEIQVM